MENQPNVKETTLSHAIMSPDDMLAHWQGHRALTRRVIEAFPEEEFFNYSLGGMRTFAQLAVEMMDLSEPGIEGMATGDWGSAETWNHSPEKAGFKTKQDILNKWDEITLKIQNIWPQIPIHRFQEVDVAFGQYKDKIFATLLYFIDNEIHHRGQGYVYLRSLGIEPPAFWER